MGKQALVIARISARASESTRGCEAVGRNSSFADIMRLIRAVAFLDLAFQPRIDALARAEKSQEFSA